MDDLDRFDIPTLDSGSKDGIHYFHLTPPASEAVDEQRQSRQRRIEAIRESLRRKDSNTKLGVVGRDGFIHGLASGVGVTTKRSASPYVEFGGEGLEHPRALFVQPSEIVFVMGAE